MDEAISDLASQYTTCYDSLHWQALRIIRQREQADDIVQQVFADTASAIKGGKVIQNYEAWLRRCVYNLAVKKARQAQQLPLHEELSNGNQSQIDDIAHARRRCGQVCSAIRTLPRAQRSALLMSQFHGYNYSEIATRMDRSEASVRQLLSRARSRIRLLVGPDKATLGGIILWTPVRKIRSLLSSISIHVDRASHIASHSLEPAVAAVVASVVISLPQGSATAPAASQLSEAGFERSTNALVVNAALATDVLFVEAMPLSDAGVGTQTIPSGEPQSSTPDVAGQDSVLDEPQPQEQLTPSDEGTSESEAPEEASAANYDQGDGSESNDGSGEQEQEQGEGEGEGEGEPPPDRGWQNLNLYEEGFDPTLEI